MDGLIREQLIKALEQGWGTYIMRFKQLSPAQQAAFLQRQGYARLADLLAHVIAWWQVGLAAVERMLVDPHYTSPDVDVDSFNARAVARFQHTGEARVIRKYESLRAAWLALVNGLPAPAFADARIAQRLEIELIGHLDEHNLDDAQDASFVVEENA